jgi:predicted MPP superfamily phosphohydrolase
LCVQYEFDSPKVDKELRFAVVADLHSCSYGTRLPRVFNRPELVFITVK